MYRRSGRAVVVVLSMACAVMAITAPTVPTTAIAVAVAMPVVTNPRASYTDDEWMAMQAPYMDLDEQVHDLPETDPSTLAGICLDVAGGRLFVYWAGEPPASLLALRRAAHEDGITVVVERAPYSLRQLVDAATALGAIAESQRLGLSTSVHTDGTGLTVAAKGLESAANERTTPTPMQAKILAAIDTVRERTGIPIGVADSVGQPIPLMATAGVPRT